MSKKTVKKKKNWNKNIAMNCQNQSTETHWSLIKAVIPKYPSTPHQAETTWTLMSHQQVAVMRSKKKPHTHTTGIICETTESQLHFRFESHWYD